MTTEPTDAELKALLLDKLPASKHYIRPIIEKMVAAMQAAIDKWGKPAQAAEPVAWLDPWTGTKVTTDYDAYGKHGIPLVRQQPVVREPLTPEHIRAMLNKHPPEDVCDWSYRLGIDDAELHHGIKGGQHVS